MRNTSREREREKGRLNSFRWLLTLSSIQQRFPFFSGMAGIEMLSVESDWRIYQITWCKLFLLNMVFFWARGRQKANERDENWLMYTHVLSAANGAWDWKYMYVIKCSCSFSSIFLSDSSGCRVFFSLPSRRDVFPLAVTRKQISVTLNPIAITAVLFAARCRVARRRQATFANERSTFNCLSTPSVN